MNGVVTTKMENFSVFQNSQSYMLHVRGWVLLGLKFRICQLSVVFDLSGFNLH